jgi:hypothetical protein
VKNLWANFTESPKTSVMGLLIFVGLTARTLEPYFPKWANALTITAALCAAYLGALMKDAGTQLAEIRGETKTVPSHETPDDPAASFVHPKT